MCNTNRQSINDSIRSRVHAGFTLIEIMAVVVILGVLAAIAIPAFGTLVSEANQSAFVADVKIISDASSLYFVHNRRFPEDTSSGDMPIGFENFIDPLRYIKGPSIGGVWDFENNDSGISAGFGVHFNGTGATRDDAYMLQIDDILEGDGLAAGSFREIVDNSRYYYVLAN